MQVVILAGGLGTRLRPITEKIPKCLAPVGDRPFLHYLLELLKQRGTTDVVICTGYLGEQVEDHFGDGRRSGLRIRYSREKQTLLGTGGALKLAEQMLDEHFLVVNGDTYLDVDYGDIYRAFTACGRRSLIVAYRVGEGERSDLEIGGDMLVSRYDKGSGGHLAYVNAGVLGLKREVVSGIEPGRPVSLEKEVFPLLIKDGQMAAFVTGQRFFDIGTFSSLKGFENSLVHSSGLPLCKRGIEGDFPGRIYGGIH